MEKAISRQGVMKDLVEVVFDFPVCVELCDDSRKWIKISNSYLITTLTQFFNLCIKIVMNSKENPKRVTWYSYCSEYLQVCYRNPVLGGVCKNKFPFLSPERTLLHIFYLRYWDKTRSFPWWYSNHMCLFTNMSARSSTPEVPFSFFLALPWLPNKNLHDHKLYFSLILNLQFFSKQIITILFMSVLPTRVSGWVLEMSVLGPGFFFSLTFPL